jgi:cortactin
MDHSAVGHDYIGKVEKHVSQRDYSTGFGGKFGVQTDRQDKVCDGISTTDRIGQIAVFQIKLHFYVMGNRAFS